MKKISFVFIGLLLWAQVVFGQQDPWQYPLSDQGVSPGLTYGSVAPSVATIGRPPAPGELWLQTGGATDGGALLRVYNATALAWQSPGTQLGVGEFITFEGATADQFETILTVVDPTADNTITLPDDIGAVFTSTLVTNEQQIVNSIWGGTNQLIFEGNVADAGQGILTWANSATNATFTFPADNADWAGAGTVVVSVLAGNAPDITNSIWGVANGLHFEGATPDDWEGSLQMADMGQDTVMYFGEYTEAIQSAVTSTLDDMDRDDVGAIWMEPNEIWFEGPAGADAFESILTVEEPTVALNRFQFMDRLGGPAVGDDVYQVTAVPDITETTGNLFYGQDDAAVGAAAQADDVMIVRRIYVPHAITVTNVDLLNIDLANVSAADNTISVAIYFDADDGVQIVEQIGVTDDGAGAATGLYTINITDTLLLPGWYRVGMCAQDASDNDIEVQVAQADILTLVAGGALASEFTSTAAANPCVAGDPEPVTGVLTQDADSLTFVLRAQ